LTQHKVYHIKSIYHTGAGAIWGFSEAVGLRVASTVWFWRPCALAVGAIFFTRWLMQVRDHIADENIRFFGGGKALMGADDEQVSLAPQKMYS